MKTVTYDIEIDSISSVYGRYPGEVDVSIHREGGDLGLRRDGFETVRVPLSEETILPDGMDRLRTRLDDCLLKACEEALDLLRDMSPGAAYPIETKLEAAMASAAF